MNREFASVADTALRAPYARVLQREEAGGFSCQVLEFPGCFSSGDSAEEAMANLEEAMALWVESETARGHDIPEPLETREFSGRMTLRLPPSLHRRAARVAELERISLNRLLTAAIAAYVGETAATSGARPDNVLRLTPERPARGLERRLAEGPESYEAGPEGAPEA